MVSFVPILADFVVYGSDGRALVVEAKVRAGSGNDTAWSTVFRENLLADSTVPVDAWFLLATPQTLFLWEPNQPPDREANWESDATPIFQSYLQRAGLASETKLDGEVFEMMVAWWLRDLRDPDAGPRSDDALLVALRRRLRDGLVVRRATAA
jgi:hypothetical protein